MSRVDRLRKKRNEGYCGSEGCWVKTKSYFCSKHKKKMKHYMRKFRKSRRKYKYVKQ